MQIYTFIITVLLVTYFDHLDCQVHLLFLHPHATLSREQGTRLNTFLHSLPATILMSSDGNIHTGNFTIINKTIPLAHCIENG